MYQSNDSCIAASLSSILFHNQHRNQENIQCGIPMSTPEIDTVVSHRDLCPRGSIVSNTSDEDDGHDDAEWQRSLQESTNRFLASDEGDFFFGMPVHVES